MSASSQGGDRGAASSSRPRNSSAATRTAAAAASSRGRSSASAGAGRNKNLDGGGDSGSTTSTGRKKKGQRPKLEQMPPEAFPLHGVDPVSPFPASFEWVNQDPSTLAPNSMSTARGSQIGNAKGPFHDLGSTKGSFGDLGSAKGSFGDLLSPADSQGMGPLFSPSAASEFGDLSDL
jgi:hypothetical protein